MGSQLRRPEERVVRNGRTSDFQVYDLYLDPRLSH
jgi:hypothetical protein